MSDQHFDPNMLADPAVGRDIVNSMLEFDPYFGATPITPPKRQGYDDIVGEARIVEGQLGREAANRFLLDNGLRELPEADGK